MGWDDTVAGLPPITLPDGRKLKTLSDCRAYIPALPKRGQARWEGTVAQLLKAAEEGWGRSVSSRW